MDGKPFPPELHPIAKLMDKADPPLVIVVGTGVTWGATRQSRASWLGLLNHGVDHLVQMEQLTEKAGKDRLEKLQLAFNPFRLDAALDAAQDIEHNLKYPDASAFALWLDSVFKDFKAHDDKKATLEALRDLEQAGVLLLTTNYDNLLEDITGLPAVTWEDHDDFLRITTREKRGILHVHGHWQRPSSIVLGRTSYERVVADSRIQELLKSLWLHKHWLYVGCGNGLDDPNLGSLLAWSKNWGAGLEDYFLAQEIASRSDKPQNLVSIGYPSHDNLPEWLRSITPTARCWPFVRIDDEFQLFRVLGSDIPFPTRQEYLDGEVPTLAADIEVEQRLQTHGWACVMDMASVGKTTLALRLATSHEQRQHPVFYLDLKEEIQNDEDDSPIEALRRLARPGVLLILDNIHHQPELAHQIWQQWRHNQHESRLLLVATRIQQSIVTTPEQDLMFFETHPTNPAVLLQPTPEDLGSLAKHIYRRFSGSSMPEPPATALAEWHRKYRAALNAFSIAVMGQLPDFQKGKWDIPDSAASAWVHKSWLKKLDADELENIICLAAFGAQELEIFVSNKALPYPDKMEKLCNELYLIAQKRTGKLGQNRLFSLREPGWGHLILAAVNASERSKEMRLNAAIRHPMLAVDLTVRLKSEKLHDELGQLWDSLDKERIGFAEKLPDTPLHTAEFLLRYSKAVNRDRLTLFFWKTIEARPGKFADRAWETSLQSVALFLKMASKHGRDTKLLWDALIGEAGQPDQQDKLDKLAERAWETSLKDVGSFLDVAKAQGRDTTPLWEAIESQPDKLAQRAWETQLDGISSFINIAKQHGRDTNPLWQAMESDPDRLSRKGVDAGLTELVGFMHYAHYASAPIIEIVLHDIKPGHWNSISLSEGMIGATWLAWHCGNASRDDLASNLITLLLHRAIWLDFPAQGGGFAQVCWLLANVPSTATGLVETFLEAVCTEDWLGAAYKYTTCGQLASGLRQLALHQSADRIRQFNHQELSWRLNKEMGRFNAAKTCDDRSQIIQLFGCAWLCGRTASPRYLANIDQGILPQLLPHRLEAEKVEDYQLQFWLGLRAFVSIIHKILPIPKNLVEETLMLWRVNLAETSTAPMSTEYLINQSMVAWLESCLRANPIALLPSKRSGQWWVSTIQ
jgi:hypothetical protein